MLDPQPFAFKSELLWFDYALEHLARQGIACAYCVLDGRGALACQPPSDDNWNFTRNIMHGHRDDQVNILCGKTLACLLAHVTDSTMRLRIAKFQDHAVPRLLAVIPSRSPLVSSTTLL